MNDGSMSADEYLRKAAELNERQEALRREQTTLDAHKRRADAEAVISIHLLTEQIQLAVAAAGPPADTVVIDFGHKKLPDIHWIPFDDADIVIHGVHRLPTRVACGHPLLAGHRSATAPMCQQMNSGKYPTVEEHRARTSTAFEPTIDEMNQFRARQLTQADEDAIRTRSH